MRGDWILMSATAASANTNPALLAAVTNYPSFTDVFGTTGTQLVDYELDDGAGHFEHGIGVLTLSTLSLARTYPTFTYDSGATPKYKKTAVAPLVTFSAAVNVRCSPSTGVMQPTMSMASNIAGDGISALGGDAQLAGYSTSGIGAAGYIFFAPFTWRGGLSVKRASVYCSGSGTGGSALVGIYALTAPGTLILIQDLTNAGASAFSLATTGIKSNTSAGGAFSEFWLPPGEYVRGVCFLVGGQLLTGNFSSGYSTILGTSSGLPINTMLTGGTLSALPATQAISGLNVYTGFSPLLYLGNL